LCLSFGNRSEAKAAAPERPETATASQSDTRNFQEKAHNLDYALLVKPHEVEATLTGAASSMFVAWYG